MLRPELAATLGADRFLKEIQIVAQLTHPHILPLHDSGEAGAFLYYVMPYITGGSLRQRLVDQGPMDARQALAIASPVADALTYAHRPGHSAPRHQAGEHSLFPGPCDRRRLRHRQGGQHRRRRPS